jgi:two-component system CheB/CheR fusion protein
MIWQRHGIDFSKYKPESLLRRMSVRMEHVGLTDYAAYADYLTRASGGCDQLFNTILVNYTAFFRDPEVWTTLARKIVRRIAASKPAHVPLRIWSAGCATGQELYSLALMLAEVLGLEQLAARVTIYATDVDSEALQHVRQGRYHTWAVRMVPPALLDRYFVPDGVHYVVREDLRRAVTVERHNLIADVPLAHIDLLLCRNVLMYLTAAAQNGVLEQLRNTITDDGVLVVGRGELALPARYGLRWVCRSQHIVAKTVEFNGTVEQRWQVGGSVYTCQF